MGRISSRSFIKLHALFQFALAIYLTWIPDVITDSGLVETVQDGFRITNLPSFTPRRSPLAYCGILLLVFAFVDLTIAIKLPAINYLLTVARCIRQDFLQSAVPGLPTTNANAATALKIASEFSALFRQLCMLLTTCRIWIYSMVSMKVYLSPDSLWVGKMGSTSSNLVRSTAAALTSAAGGQGLVAEELKGKIVLGYGVMEVLFSCWLFLALHDEQLDTERKLRSASRDLGRDMSTNQTPNLEEI